MATDRTVSPNGVNRLLRPRSIAIVGASDTPGALGNTLLSNLERAGFSGPIHLINPRRQQIGVRPCLQTIDELPLNVDVAVLAIPRASVMESLGALARRGVGAAVIFSAGFAEGGETGQLEQREMARIATESGMIIEGPNCLGMINFVENIPLTFVQMPRSQNGQGKPIGIISQSGAMAAVVAITLMAKQIPLSFFVSTGNEAASGIEDYIDYLISDNQTDVIGLIAEQIRQPQRFLKLARRALAKSKPIVLLHPGRSAEARASAATHTGAIAGDYKVMRMLVERAGVVVCRDLEEFGDVLDLAVRAEGIHGGAAILCESGAFKALSLDVAKDIGLELPVLTESNSPMLRAAMPSFVPVSNPVDLTAQALVDPDLYRRTLEALLVEERIGAVVLCIIQTDESTSRLKFPAIIDAIERLNPLKPIIFAGVDDGAVVPATYLSTLRGLGVPYFPTADRAFRALARWSTRSDTQEPASVGECGPARRFALPHDGGVIPEYQSKLLLAEVGVPVPSNHVAVDLQEAKEVAAAIGWPVAVKAQSRELSHKSDVGGVILNVADETALTEAWGRLHANVAAHKPSLALDGVLIEAMGRRGAEWIVGGRNDPEWGPVILIGAGGVMAELFSDVRLLPPDLSIEAIAFECHKLKSGALLRGFRGTPALDVQALAEVIRRVGALLTAEPRIREIDLNPVVVYPVGEGAIALDALMSVAPAD